MKRRTFLFLPFAAAVIRQLSAAQSSRTSARRFGISAPLLNDVFVGSPNDFQALLLPGKGALETLAAQLDLLASHRAKNDRVGEATTCLSIGDLYNFTEDKLAALKYFQIGLEVVPQSESVLRFDALSRVAIAYDDLGAADQSIDFYGRALDEAEAQKERVLIGRTFHNRAEAYRNAGRSKNALDDYSRALSVWHSIQQGTSNLSPRYWEAMIGEQASATGMGRLFFQDGRVGDAEKIFTELIDFADTAQSVSGLATTLICLGKLHLQVGRPQRARDEFEMALEIRRQGPDPRRQAVAQFFLALAQAAEGQPDEAVRQLQECRALLERSGNSAEEAIALFQIGAIEANRGDLRAALRALLEAIDVQERLRGQANIERFRADASGRLSDLYQSTFLVNWAAGNRDGSELFRLVERGRARTVLDQISGADSYAEGAATPAARNEETALRQHKDDLEKQLATEEIRVGPELRPTLILELRKQLGAAQRSYEDLWNRIRLSQSAAASLRSAPTLSLEHAKAAVPPSVALLSYFRTASDCFCFVIGRDVLELIKLPVSEPVLDRAIERFRLGFKTAGAHASILQDLWKHLLVRVLPLIEDKPVIGIVPHRSLHYIPFAALSDGRTYFGDRHELFSLPSVSLLPVMLKRRRPQDRLLAMGQGSAPGMPLLREIESAVKDVAALFGTDATLKAGPEATKSALLAHAAQSDILLLAAHADLNVPNPLFSRILLGPDAEVNKPGASATGVLELHEVYQLSLMRADLVVLSGCQTGIGEASRGDDVVGLHTAFCSAGAASVIATLWKVDEIPASELVRVFFRKLHGEKMSKSKALQEAQREVRLKYPNLYDWASFVLTGDPGAPFGAKPA